MHSLRFILALLAAAATCTISTALANDWPQWLGPDRTGVSTETGLLKTWPKDGPTLKWKVKGLGGGYSAPAVVGERIYVLGKFGDDENALALDAKDGSRIWSVKIGKVGPNPDSYPYPGPRGTPTVVGDKLYALGSNGDLVCLDTAKGATVWTKNLRADFDGAAPKWAYSESPLVDGDNVVVSPGGKKATVVALRTKDGTPVWKAAVPAGDAAGYGSPIRIEAGGIKQYVVFLSKGVVGVAAADGKVLWRFDAAANRVANIPTPMFNDGIVFAVSGYGAGGGVAALIADNGAITAKPGWFKAAVESQIGGFVNFGGHLYGAGVGGKLMCVEFATGKVLWQNAGVGNASLCCADGMLFVRGHNGTVALVEASPTAFKEHGRFKQPDRTDKPAWPYPVVANGAMYLRDQDVLLCYDVHDPKAK